eukprot:14161610-Ditylum_brightwellii.AAC.1
MGTTRRSCCDGGVAIKMSDAKYDSDYMTLHLPRELCCNICVNKLIPTLGCRGRAATRRRAFNV